MNSLESPVVVAEPEAPLVQAVCANCGGPMRMYASPVMARAEPDGRGGWRAPVARMWGGLYTHYKCPSRG